MNKLQKSNSFLENPNKKTGALLTEERTNVDKEQRDVGRKAHYLYYIVKSAKQTVKINVTQSEM